LTLKAGSYSVYDKKRASGCKQFEFFLHNLADRELPNWNTTASAAPAAQQEGLNR